MVTWGKEANDSLPDHRWMQDFYADRRRRKLSNYQPLMVNWSAVIGLGSALLVSLAIWAAIWRYGWVAVTSIVVGTLVLGFCLPYLLAGLAWVASAIRGEAGGTGV